MRTHIAVWIDHAEAHVLRVQPESPGHPQPEPIDEKTVLSPRHVVHRHQRGQGEASEHPEDATHFFREVARAVADADTLLIAGPSSAKHDFVKYLDAHEKSLRAKVAGVETVDHPTDREMSAYARKYFKASDRM